MGAIYLRRDGAWRPAVGLHVRGPRGDWVRARKVFVYRQNPQVNETDPITFGWYFVRAFAPPLETVQMAVATGPREDLIEPGTPVNVRVSWTPRSSDTYAGYYVGADLKYAAGPTAGGIIGGGWARQAAGYLDIEVPSEPSDVYADVYYFNEVGAGPQFQTNTTRIG
ncbi:MAG: hypothetical protein KY444_00755 [Gemmatimonadetes bacterium]|nr:hypothetical protein [Gemmatimonadota bacterium]